MNRFLFSCVLLLSGQIFAQDVILPKQGNPITAYELVVSDAYVFYQTSLDSTAQTARIAKDDILMIRKADGIVLNLTESTSANAVQPTKETVQEDRFPIVNIDNYHGYLLQKGNCVYIPTDSPYDFERAGQEELKRLMEEAGIWQVVDKLEQAHFVLIYNTCLSGQDYSQAVLRTRGEYQNYKTVFSSWLVTSDVGTDICIFGANTDETISTNKKVAAVLTEAIAKRMISFGYKDSDSFCKVYGKHSKRAKAWIIP